MRYRSPTPLHEELHFDGEIVRTEGRKTFAEARVHAGERLCAEAEGIFVSARPETFEKLLAERRKWESEHEA